MGGGSYVGTRDYVRYLRIWKFEDEFFLRGEIVRPRKLEIGYLKNFITIEFYVISKVEPESV